jgi:NDP-sugar pyrophosphorylase family protein
MHMTETLQRVIDAGKIEIEALSYRGQWMEVDSEKDLIHGNSVLL